MLVDVETLKAHMSGISLTAPQSKAAEEDLVEVQSELEEYLNRPVEITEVTETLGPSDRLSVNPVHEIVDVVGETDWSGSFRLGSWDPVLKGHGNIVRPTFGTYTITYRGGLDGTNIPALRKFILRVVARSMSSSHDDTVSIKDLTSDEPPDGQRGPMEEDWLRVQRYQRIEFA